MKQNVLLLGSGGREHAMAVKIKESKLCGDLYIAPGNGGSEEVGINVNLSLSHFEQIGNFILEKKISLVVVGPEGPLVEGIVDYFQQEPFREIRFIGPDSYAAQLEGSKSFAKKFMQKYNIPTAGYVEVSMDNLEEGITFLNQRKPPYVLKADGLAGGKGVLILDDVEEAIDSLKKMLGGQFGEASKKVVLEEFLDGIEFSAFVLTDGNFYTLLPQAKDYKRVGEGDEGLNTGGMGAVSPVSFINDVLMNKVIRNIIEPTINGIKEEKMLYKGFVFFGLIVVNNEPFVIEYNCRMGDPETEVVLPRLDEDIVDLFLNLFNSLTNHSICKEKDEFATTVMLVSGGYPGSFEKNKTIKIPKDIPQKVKLFHAGTKNMNGVLVTDGGRVMAVTSMASTMREAVEQSVEVAQHIDFEGKYFRKDIGFDL
ncbi:MAG: phosphoribosylamine--glycine ligase [Saprospiraceae bacterium]